MWWAEYSSRKYSHTVTTCPWCCYFLVPILRGSERGAFSPCVLCSCLELSWLSPAVASAPGHSCPPWQLSSGFLIRLFWDGLHNLQQAERGFPGRCLVRGVKSLCATCFTFMAQRSWSVCVCGAVGAPGVQAAHVSPCHGVLLACLVCATCSKCCLPAFGAKAVWSHTAVQGSLSPRARVWPVPCSCDNPHLLRKGDCVLWHRAWGHQKQSTIQPYNQGDFPKLHVHIWYGLPKHKNLLNFWSSQKSQLADTQISFACPITPLISFPVCWFTLTGGMSTLPHAHRDRAVSEFLWWVSFTSPGVRSKPCRHKSVMVTSQLFSLSKAGSILPCFFRHCGGVLAQIHPKVRTCDLTHL